MDLKTYRVAALATEHTELRGNVSLRLQHAIIGLCSEAGEVAEYITLDEYDDIALAAECGDLLWYTNLALDSQGMTFDDLDDVTLAVEDIFDALALVSFESSKLADILKKALFYRNRPVDPDKLRAHLSNLMALVRLILTRIGLTVEDVAQANVDKLMARYAK